MKSILLAHDGSRSSDKAMKKAFEIAQKFGSSISVISVAPELYLMELLEPDRKRIREMLTEEAEKIMKQIATKAKGIKPIKTIIKQGNPADEIIKAARKIKADIIITGSHGRSGAKKLFLGSVSSRIVDHAPCTVLVVK